MRAQGARRPHRGAAIPVAPRTALALGLASLVGLIAFTWPLLLGPDSGLEHATDAPLVLAAVLLAVVGIVLVALSEGGIDVKAIAVLGLLTALGSVLRPLSAGTAGVELVFLTIVLGGRVFGPGFGFTLGSTTLFASALLTGGAGPWLPFQMLGASWVGLGAGLLPRGPRGRREIVMVAGYGVFASFCFGVLMNLSFWPFLVGAGTELSFVPGDPVGTNLHRFMLYTVGTSLGWEVGRAVSTAVGISVLGPATLRALRRTSSRAVFGAEPVDDALHRTAPGAGSVEVDEPPGAGPGPAVSSVSAGTGPSPRHARVTD